MRRNPMLELMLTLLSVAAVACGTAGSGESGDARDDPGDFASGTLIRFTAPLDGAVVSWPSVQVSGTVEGASCTDLTLNGSPVPWSPPHFSAPVPLANEGENTIAALCGDASATLTVVLDSLPPYLALVSPEAATVLPKLGPGDSVQVTGFAEDEAGVTTSLLGEPVNPGPAPTGFSASWPLDAGLNLVHVEAVDGNGNRSREHRPVLAGPFGECTPVPGRPDVVVRLSDGAVSLAADMAMQELLATDFTPVLAESNPVYDSEQIRLDIDSLVIEAPINLQTTAVDGSFAAELLVGAVHAAGTLTFKTSGAEWTFQADIDGLTAAASVVPSVAGGVLSLAVSGVTVDADEVAIAVQDESGKSVVAPTEITGNFLAFFTELLSSVLQDMADQAALSAASSVQGDVAFSLFGIEVAAKYAPESILVGGHQVTVGYLVNLAFSGDKAVTWPHGCPLLGGSAPLPPPPVDLETASFGLSLSQDFVNRTLTGLWTAGELFVVIDQSMLDGRKLEVDLVCGLAGSLATLVTEPPSPESPLAIQVTPQLPPLLQPMKDDVVGIALGAVRLELFAEEANGSSRLFSSILLSLVLGLHAEVAESDIEFFLSMSDFFIELDQSMSPLQERQAERDIESFFESLIPEITNTLASSLVKYHLPLFYGVEIVEGEVALSPEGYLVVQGRVVGKGSAP
jgi:hypothetical protein